MSRLQEIGAHVLLFFLVFGMSATVDIPRMKKQMRNRSALLIGIALQFLILPFVGFAIVRLLNLSAPLGITLLVVTSSPGGSYSNCEFKIWWCSLFNAELALSVTMTGLSTALSVFMLPLNLSIYVSSIYDGDVVKNLNWFSLILSLIVVITGIVSGVLSSAWQNSTRFNLRANQMGNLAGVSLVVYSALVSSSSQDASLWSQDPSFYIGVSLPAIFGVLIASQLASKADLEKPERVAVAVEACYQNTGIATSVAITMFEGADEATAIGVPLFYGIVEMVVLAIYCVACWKMGWTKAPADENLCTVIGTSYEVENARTDSPNAIEVVHGQGEEDLDNMVFTQTNEGYKVDEGQFEETSNAERISKGAHALPVDDKELI
ncbi:MAG: hypothetical protein SGBAC_002588 [Bacillariaceae sp.]